MTSQRMTRRRFSGVIVARFDACEDGCSFGLIAVQEDVCHSSERLTHVDERRHCSGPDRRHAKAAPRDVRCTRIDTREGGFRELQ